MPRQPEPFVLADIAIDYVERSVIVSGRPAQLTPTEYKLLSELSVNAGRVLTHDQLLHRVWGDDRAADLRVLRSFVKSVGYRLAKPEQVSAG